MREMAKFGALFVFALPLAVMAQNMREAELKGQPLTTTKQGVVTGCGLRIVGQALGSGEVRLFDVSLNIGLAGGMAKLTGSAGPANAKDIGQLKAQPIYGGWFKAKGQAPAAPSSKLISGETPHSKLFVVDLDAAANNLFAMVYEHEVQIAIRWVPGVESIYYGKVSLTDKERDQFDECIKELTKK